MSTTPMGTRILEPGELLAHLDFIQRVAADLVRDHEVARDVAQDALQAALATGWGPGAAMPRHGARAWLFGLVRNVARRRSRDKRLRQQHEGSFAQEHVTESPEDVTTDALERGETRARVARAVMDLDEPYRTVILLRYVDDRSPPEIADALRRPHETVRTQLRRGLQQLREALDARHGGDGERWAIALVPLALPRLVEPQGAPSAASPAASSGAVLPRAASGVTPSGVAVAVVGTVLLGVGGWTAHRLSTSPPASEPPSIAHASPVGAPLESPGVATRQAARAGVTRSRVTSTPARSAGSSDGAAQASTPKNLRVRVVDQRTGRPVAGAVVLGAPARNTPLGLRNEFAGRTQRGEPRRLPGSPTDATSFLKVPASRIVSGARPANTSMGSMPDLSSLDPKRLGTTDSEGVLEVEWTGRRMPALLVKADRFADATWMPARRATPSADAAPIEIEMLPGAALVIERGALAPNLPVLLHVQDAHGVDQAIVTLKANAPGIRIDGLSPGSYGLSGRATSGRVWVWKRWIPDVALATDAPSKVSLSSQPTADLGLEISGLPRTKALRVELTRDGDPNWRRRWALDRPEGIAEAAVTIPSVALGTWHVRVSDRSLLLHEATLQHDSETRSHGLRLPPGALDVVLPKASVESFALTLTHGAADAPSRRMTGTPGTSVAFAGLLPGAYALWISDGRSATRAELHVGEGRVSFAATAPGSGASMAEVHLSLCTCASLGDRFLLRAEGGATVPLDLSILAKQHNPTITLSGRGNMTRTGAPASERIWRVPPGSYSLELTLADGDTETVALDVPPGVSRHTVHLGTGHAPTELTVAAPPGAEPPRFVQLQRIPRGNRRPDAFELIPLDPAGSARCLLRPGEYRVVAQSAAGDAELSGTLTVTETSTAKRVELAPKSAAAPAKGAAEDAAGG